MSTGEASAKLLLVGEHAVVHGQVAFALPFPALRARVEATRRPGPLAVTSPDSDDLAGLLACARETLAELGQGQDVSLRIRSEIPAGRGLGSSAAVATALVRALRAGQPHDLAAERRLAHVAECHAHGKPSGVDGAVVALGRPLAFRVGEPPREVTTGGSFTLLVADSGLARDTRAAVAAVAALEERDQDVACRLFAELGVLAEDAMRGWQAGEALAVGAAMNAAHAVLFNLGVGHERLERLVLAARDAGALGAKLTGAGLGGCVVVLVDGNAPAVEAALRSAGAAAVWSWTYSPASIEPQ